MWLYIMNDDHGFAVWKFVGEKGRDIRMVEKFIRFDEPKSLLKVEIYQMVF